MSIRRRFIDVARAELNSLLDFAARRGPDGGDDGGDDGDGTALHGFTEKELQEELERRRRARQEVEEAIHGRRPSPGTGSTPPRAGARESGGAGTGAAGGTGGGSRRTAPPPTAAPPSEAAKIRKAYAALEVPPGSDFETVRKAYRALMRKYHPDHHTGSPEKQRAANEVAQRLTEAYKVLEKKLRPR